jgi:hypothetical protein
MSKVALHQSVSVSASDSSGLSRTGTVHTTERRGPAFRLSYFASRSPSEREFFIDNLLIRIHLIEIISVDRPCSMEV